MQLQRGSLVQCDTDFEELRQMYNHKYPYRGDLLTVRGIAVHFRTGEQLCTFEELVRVLAIPLAAGNFTELQSPDEGDAIINNVKKLLC